MGEESQSSSSQKNSKVTDIQVGRNQERNALGKNITAVARRIRTGRTEG
jgi:hypothetical protein